jgi:hypothetical protein
MLSNWGAPTWFRPNTRLMLLLQSSIQLGVTGWLAAVIATPQTCQDAS